MPLRVIKRLTIVVPANRTGLASNIIVRLSVRAATGSEPCPGTGKRRETRLNRILIVSRYSPFQQACRVSFVGTKSRPRGNFHERLPSITIPIVERARRRPATRGVLFFEPANHRSSAPQIFRARAHRESRMKSVRC